MLSDTTLRQIEALDIIPGHPLVICDVDEVVVHFTKDFESYLIQRDMWLETTAFALNGMIMSKNTGRPVPSSEIGPLIDRFFEERTLHMQPIEGAVEALLGFANHAQVVMLTNLPHSCGDYRRKNLHGHGLRFPVVTNSGPKGPAVSLLASKSGHQTVFIDDSPSYISSAWEHAPHVHLIHFMHDERFSRHVPPLEFVSLRTDNWSHAGTHILELLSRAKT